MLAVSQLPPLSSLLLPEAFPWKWSALLFHLLTSVWLRWMTCNGEYYSKLERNRLLRPIRCPKNALQVIGMQSAVASWMTDFLLFHLLHSCFFFVFHSPWYLHVAQTRILIHLTESDSPYVLCTVCCKVCRNTCASQLLFRSLKPKCSILRATLHCNQMFRSLTVAQGSWTATFSSWATMKSALKGWG